jgi:hypothetical protein
LYGRANAREAAPINGLAPVRRVPSQLLMCVLKSWLSFACEMLFRNRNWNRKRMYVRVGLVLGLTLVLRNSKGSRTRARGVPGRERERPLPVVPSRGSRGLDGPLGGPYAFANAPKRTGALRFVERAFARTNVRKPRATPRGPFAYANAAESAEFGLHSYFRSRKRPRTR